MRDPAGMHACYACASEGRIHYRENGGSVVRIASRFSGPPGNANGGIAAGALVCPALTAASDEGAGHAVASRVSARLRRGVPVGRDIDAAIGASADGYGVALAFDGGDIVTGSVAVTRMAARPGEAIGAAPVERAEDIAQLAPIAPPDRPPFYIETGDHPIPGCFSCGPENAQGLAIYPRFAGDGVVCAPWAPSADFDDGGGALSQLIIASALDCSSGICLPLAMQRELIEDDGFYLLGSLDVRYLRVAPVDATYRVAAKMLLRDGRKFFGFSALFDDQGVPYATAEATWIISSITRTEAFGVRA